MVTTLEAGLNDPARPIGVLLLCGPTGVGKTALAPATSEEAPLAEHLGTTELLRGLGPLARRIRVLRLSLPALLARIDPRAGPDEAAREAVRARVEEAIGNPMAP